MSDIASPGDFSSQVNGWFATLDGTGEDYTYTYHAHGYWLMAFITVTGKTATQTGPAAYTSEETAALLKVSANHVRRQVNEGAIAGSKLGKRISIPATEVARLLGCAVAAIPPVPTV
jgi:excisionase family DNA binding protein